MAPNILVETKFKRISIDATEQNFLLLGKQGILTKF